MTEEQIIAFIEENPDFFTNNPELLHKIQLNFSKFYTSSLVEKRIANLTNENTLLKKAAIDNLSISKDNVELSNLVHLFTLEMLKKHSKNDFFECLHSVFKDLFSFDEIQILSKTPSKTSYITGISEQNKISDFIKKEKIYYGTKEQYHANSFLNKNIKSIAIINLSNKKEAYLLLIGSKSIQRFTPDKDQFFITNIQQIMDRKLNEL